MAIAYSAKWKYKRNNTSEVIKIEPEAKDNKNQGPTPTCRVPAGRQGKQVNKKEFVAQLYSSKVSSFGVV